MALGHVTQGVMAYHLGGSGLTGEIDALEVRRARGVEGPGW